MEKNVILKCNNAHEAVRVCTLKTCTSPSLICKEANCQYSTVHKRCTSFQTDQIVLMLRQKARNLSLIVNEIVGSALITMIKNIQVIKSEYDKASQNLSQSLKGDERMLLNQLTNGETNELKGALVGGVLERLLETEGKKEQIKNMQVQKIQETIEKILIDQQKALQQIKACWSGELQGKTIADFNKPNIPFVFKDGLYNKQSSSIANNGKTARGIKKQGTTSAELSIIYPCIKQTARPTLKLKISKIPQKRHIIVGVYDKSKIIENKFQLDSKNATSIRSEGYVLNPKDTKYNRKLTDLKFGMGDILQFEYVGEAKELRIKNLNTKTSIVLDNISNESGELSYFVAASHADEQFEILYQ